MPYVHHKTYIEWRTKKDAVLKTIFNFVNGIKILSSHSNMIEYASVFFNYSLALVMF